jgi:hypothetical protein
VARVFGEIQGVESGQLFASPDSCGLIRTFKLERPVFGGTSNRALNVAMRFGDETRATVTVSDARGRVVKRFPARSYRGGQVHRLRVSVTRRFARGTYRVRLGAQAPGRQATAVLRARRL